MQVELRQLQQQLGITTIVVTHDQREAMTMADLVVVMGEGRIRQAGAPVEIYRKPADAFVADFIGSTNLLAVDGRQRRRAVVLGRPHPGPVAAGRRQGDGLGPPGGHRTSPTRLAAPIRGRSPSCAISARPSRPSSTAAAPS